MNSDWRAAPERAELQRAVELIASDPSGARMELERLAASSSEIARQMAMYNIAIAYSNGMFGEPDYAKAEEWYASAARNGLREAEFGLGHTLRKIGQYARALDVFRRSAAIGYSPSMRAIGGMYFRGEGVPHDLNQSRLWWERSIERGNVFAKRDFAFAKMKGKYGWAQRPLGVVLFLSAVASACHIIFTSSERDERLK